MNKSKTFHDSLCLGLSVCNEEISVKRADVRDKRMNGGCWET